MQAKIVALVCLLFVVAAGNASAEESPKESDMGKSPSQNFQVSPEELDKLCQSNPDIPHGTIHTETFVCKTTGVTKKCCVWTPPGYEKSEAEYPVFYLLHGIGDDETGWKVKGSADNILDNSLSKGRMKPMIVVMPNGFVSGEKPNEQVEGGGVPWKEMPTSQKFDDYFTKDVMRVVEAKYRVKGDREHRAIAGLSMGGKQSLDVGLKHLDLFCCVGNFSGAVHRGNMFEEHPVLKDAKTLNDKLKVFYHACGKTDFLYEANKKFVDDITQGGVRHIYREMEGAHTWPVWKQCLAEILPLISGAIGDGK